MPEAPVTAKFEHDSKDKISRRNLPKKVAIQLMHPFGKFRRGEVDSREALLGAQAHQELTSDQAVESKDHEQYDVAADNFVEGIYGGEIALLHHDTERDPTGFLSLKKEADVLAVKKEDKELRKFTDEDKKRHSRLLDLAKKKTLGIKGGLKNPTGFIDLIEYLESNTRHSVFKHEPFDHEPSAKEIEGLSRLWNKEKDEIFVRPDEGKFIASTSDFVPVDIGEYSVPFLRDIANLVSDPVSAVRALDTLGLTNLYNISSINKYNFREVMKDIDPFVRLNNSAEFFKTVNGIDNWSIYQRLAPAEMLQVAKKITTYSEQVVDKMNTISKFFGQMKLEEVDSLGSVVSDPEKFNYAVALLRRSPTYHHSDTFFKSIDLLKESGDLSDLTILLNSGVSMSFIDKLQKGLGSKEQITEVKDFLTRGEVHTFLIDSSIQDFAKLSYVKGGVSSDIDMLVVNYGVRSEIFDTFKYHFTMQDVEEWNNSGRRTNFFQAIGHKLISEKDPRIFLSEKFNAFTKFAKEEYEIEFLAKDYLADSSGDVISIFKTYEIVKELEDRDVQRLMLTVKNSPNYLRAVIDEYVPLQPYISVLALYNEHSKNGISYIASHRQDFASKLEKITVDGFLKENILSQISKDQLKHWLDLALELSADNQKLFLYTSSETITTDSIKKLQDISSYIQILKDENSETREELVKTFIGYGGDINELLSNNLPTKKLADAAISQKNSLALRYVLRDSDIRSSFEGQEAALLDDWCSLPAIYQKEILEIEPDFPHISQENTEKYRFLAANPIFFRSPSGTSLLSANIDVLKILPEECPWLFLFQNQQLNSIVINGSKELLQKKSDLDFISNIYSLVGDEAANLLQIYVQKPETDRAALLGFAHKYKDPLTVKDAAMRMGYKLMGDHLSFESYEFLKSIMEDSADQAMLQKIGITEKGEVGLTQLENIMHSFVMGLGSNNVDYTLLENKIVADLFKNYVRYESSFWGNHDSASFNNIIQYLQDQKVKSPQISNTDMFSSGVQEIIKLERSTNVPDLTETFLSRYGTLSRNIQVALDISSQPRSFSTMAKMVDEKRLEVIKRLTQDYEANENPKAKEHIKKRIDSLTSINPSDVKSFQANFAELSQEKAFSDLLMQSVFLYTLKKYPEQAERMTNVLTEGPNIDSITAVLDFTEHMTTKEAWKDYFTDKRAKKAFQSILDTKELYDGVSRLQNSANGVRGTSIVEFVPNRGLLMEFSGNIGDACWASKYKSIAAEFPNMTSIIIQDISKETPKPLGSSMLIEATGNDGTPLLVIRGLNPLESYINHVDVADFYNKYTDYIKKVAEQRGRKAAIVIDYHSGGAATNRPVLFNYMSSQKESLSPVGVSPDSTTFNGYDISRSTFLL